MSVLDLLVTLGVVARVDVALPHLLLPPSRLEPTNRAGRRERRRGGW